jgi:RNA recognition motif-containing protein
MESRTVFVGNLPRESTEDDIKARFSASGEISDVRFPHRASENRSFCFITFATAAQAQDAIAAQHRSEFNGARIDVELSKNPPYRFHDGRHEGRRRREESPPRRHRRRARGASSDSDSDERPRRGSRRRSRDSSDSDSEDSGRAPRRHRSNRRDSPRRDRDRDRARVRDRDRDRRGSRRRSRSPSASPQRRSSFSD